MLKLDVAELRAENYKLGEKFIAKDIRDKEYKMRIEENEIDGRVKEIQIEKLKD